LGGIKFVADVSALATQLAELSPEERRSLIAALLPEPPPAGEQIVAAEFKCQNDPAMKGTLDDPAPVGGPEPRDSPESRAKLLAILKANPSGVDPYTLLDLHHIPGETIELARREGQAGWAERGIGLTHQWGGPWARDRDNIDEAAVARFTEMFKKRLITPVV
jgi:hypothetical protein